MQIHVVSLGRWIQISQRCLGIERQRQRQRQRERERERDIYIYIYML